MDLFLKTKLVEKYNSEKEKDIKGYYLEGNNIVKEKKNGYKKVYHYYYIEPSYKGFLNEEELYDAIDYIKCILNLDEYDDKAISSYVELWSKGTSTFHHVWKNIEVGKIYDDTEQFAEILQGLRNDNMFITPNTFTHKSHGMDALMSINAITIDLDYKKIPEYKNYEPEEIIKILEDKYFFGTATEIASNEVIMPSYKIPKPNFIEYSNQIRLIYLIDKIKLSKKGRLKMIKFIKAIKKKIELRLKCFGADTTPNLNSFIRVPYSINNKAIYKRYCVKRKGKNKTYKRQVGEDRYTVYVKEYSRVRYDIQNIADKFIDRKSVEEYVTSHKKKKKKKRKLIKFKEKNGRFLISKFNLDRLEDIEKLQGFKNKGMVSIHRQTLCFAYMVHLKLYGYDYNTIITRMELFINKFDDNTSSNVLISKCKNVMKQNYRFTSKGIREFFDISESFCIENGLNSFVRMEYTPEYKREYAKEYYNTYLRQNRKFHHLKLEDKKRIIKLNDEGLSVADIANKLGCKVQTVYFYLKDKVKAVKKNIQKSIEDALILISEGLNIKEAAKKLNVKYETLKKRIYRYKKLNTI